MALSLNSSNAFYNISMGIPGYPFSLLGWFRVPNVTTFTSLMGLVSFSTGARCDVYFAGDGGKQAVAKTVSGSSAAAYSTSAMTPGQWHHLAAVFASDNERKIFLDGGNVGVNNDSLSMPALEFYYFGNANGPEMVDVADVSLVQAAITAEQAARLASGVPLLASTLRRDVVAYHDCIRQPNRPGWGPTLTMAGAATAVEQPRMMFAVGGYSHTTPNHLPGPWRVESSLARSLSADEGQHATGGAAFDNMILAGEVSS